MNQPASKRLLTEERAGLLYIPVPANPQDGQVLGYQNGIYVWITPSGTVPVLSNTVAPVVTGSTVVGSVLSVSNGTWVATPDSFTYQWTRNGVAITGATGASYTTVPADVGMAVTAIVTAVRVGFTSGFKAAAAVTVTAAATAELALTANNGVGTLSGTGLTLTGNGVGLVTSSLLTNIGGGVGRIAA